MRPIESYNIGLIGPDRETSVEYLFIYYKDGSRYDSELSKADPVRYLQAVQSSKLTEIDEKTKEVILRGYEFPPGAGSIFSLSLVAQSNAKNLRDKMIELSLPAVLPERGSEGEVFVSTQGGGRYTFSSGQEVEDWYQSLYSYISGAYRAGMLLRESVLECSTIEEVELIIDNR